MAEWSIQHGSEIVNGAAYKVKAEHLIDNFDGLKSDIDDRLSMTTASTQTVTSAVTWNGTQTFTVSPKMDAILECTTASGVTVDGALIKDSMITVSGTPTAAGMIGYASNLLKFHNGTTVINVGETVSAVNSRSSNTIWDTSDNGALFVCTSTFTQTITAAATLGVKWHCHIRNDGTGVITIDPNGAETIDGQTTLRVYPGESFTVVCDGTNFKTVGRTRGLVYLASATASTSASVSFTSLIDSGFDEYVIDVVNYLPATDNTLMWLRVSEDGGSTWKSGASDYGYGNFTVGNGTTLFGSGSGGDTKIIFGPRSAAGEDFSNTAARAVNGQIRFFNPCGTTVNKRFMAHLMFSPSGGGTQQIIGHGHYVGTANAINGIQILSSSGNITSGSFYLYGVRKD